LNFCEWTLFTDTIYSDFIKWNMKTVQKTRMVSSKARDRTRVGFGLSSLLSCSSFFGSEIPRPVELNCYVVTQVTWSAGETYLIRSIRWVVPSRVIRTIMESGKALLGVSGLAFYWCNTISLKRKPTLKTTLNVMTLY
jgi:hypothetical protein